MTNGLHPLPKTAPADWTPEEIIHSRFSMQVKDSVLEFISAPNSQIICGYDVDDFVRELARPTTQIQALGNRFKDAHDPYVGPMSPLDIYVGAPCYVVVELDPAWNWQFRADGPAVTTKEPYGDHNCCLRHVSANGDLLPGAAPGEDGCRIAFFSVTNRPKHSHPHFNYHVEFLMPDGRKVPLIIDPDVPNDGGSIPMLGCSRDSWPSSTVPRHEPRGRPGS